MKILFVTDLHGCKWKYDLLVNTAQDFRADVVINGGDMLPKDDDLFNQENFIDNFIDEHFQLMNDVEIYYLFYLGNDDLRVFDGIFEEKCNQYPFIVNLVQCKFALRDFEFVSMNWVVDYPFRIKDRCRMDTTDYKFQDQLSRAPEKL